MATSTSTQPSNPFTKQLASNDRRQRDAAVSSLRLYLSRSAPLAPLEMLKLWKGLFYCMWMSDKPRTQQRLALDLADLVTVLRGTNFIPFVRAFWTTMGREWEGIDSLRMDKFLFLIRTYVNAGFAFLRRAEWEEGVVGEYLAVLRAGPLSPRDVKIPNGLRYHVVDVFVDELQKVDPDAKAPIEVLLKPLRQLGKESMTKSVKDRVREALEDDRLQEWGVALDGKRDEEIEVEDDGEVVDVAEDGAEEDEWGGIED